MRTRRFDVAASKWLVIAGAVVPLALVGCGTGQRTSQSNPTQRVAGERQEDETPRLIREAGLPESFVFGGRHWKAHQIHWEEMSSIGDATTRPGDTTTRPGDTTATPGDTTTRLGDAAKYLPVADLKVDGHQIFRQRGVDEALTDNIFIKAENMPARAAKDDEAKTDAGAQRVAFVEYDASGSTMADMELSTALTAAGLQQNITHGGKKWVAEEIQVYDADVFDEVAAAPQMMNGHKVYRDKDDADTLFVMAEVPMTMPGTTGEGATGSAPGTTGDGAAATTRGTVFIRYELSK